MHIKDKIENFKIEFNQRFENEIKKIINEQLAFAESETIFDPKITESILNYTSGGKRIRPFLIFYFSEYNLENENLMRACIATELFHLAALIHDDIMDESDTRRGVPTIHIAAQKIANQNNHLGNDIALLLGDMFLTAAIAHAALLPKDIFEEFRLMIARTIRGQYLDSFTMNTELGNVDKKSVRTRHLLKTAWYTFCSPARIGSLLSENKNQTELQILSEIMLDLGLLFQIRDDIIDCVDIKSGKKLFGDIFENQTTWVTLHIKEHYPKKFAEILIAKQKNDVEMLQFIFNDIDLVTPYQTEFNIQKNNIQKIAAEHQDLQNKAIEILSILPLNL